MSKLNPKKSLKKNRENEVFDLNMVKNDPHKFRKVCQIFTENIYFTVHFSTFISENTLSSRTFRLKTIPKHCLNHPKKTLKKSRERLFDTQNGKK